MAEGSLQIIVSPGTHEGQKILRVQGALTAHTAFQFQDAMRKETSPALIIDCTGVPYIDSAGLGALVAAYIGSRKTMRKLAFVGMNEQIRALIDLTQVARLFHTYASIKDAETSLVGFM